MPFVPAPVVDALERHRRWLVTTHVQPDPDAIGSQVAALRLLERLGRQAFGLNHSPTPEVARFLDPDGHVQCIADAGARDVIERVDAVLVLDVSSADRIGDVWPAVASRRLPSVCIDHHANPEQGVFDVLWSDTGASAVGQMMVRLYQQFDQSPDAHTAAALYAALVFDTGNFRFSNTTPDVLRCAAQLVEWGAVPTEVYSRLHSRKTYPQVRLYGRVLAELETLEDARICLLRVTRRMMQETGTTPDDVMGLVEIPRDVGAAEIILLFVEDTDGTVKLSVRSKGALRADRLCAQFGGGGHPRASGATLPSPIEEAEARVVEALRKALRRTSG